MTFSNNAQSLNSQSYQFTSNQEEESFNLQAVTSAVKRRGWLLLLIMMGVTGGIWVRILFFSEKEPPVYESSFKLLVEPIKSQQKQLQDIREDVGQMTQSNFDYQTQTKVLTHSEVMKPIHENLQEKYPNLGYEELVENITINRIEDSKLIAVRYRHTNPQLTQDITQALSEKYIAYSEDQQKRAQQQVIDFIAQKIPQLNEQVDSIEQDIQAFRAQHNLINPIQRAETVSSQIENLKQRQQETERTIEEQKSLQENLSKQLGLSLDEAMTTVALSEAPRYQELLGQLREIETEMAIKLARYKENTAIIERLKRQRSEILELLKEEAATVVGEENVDSNLQSKISSPNPVRLSLTQDLIETTNQIRTLEVRLSSLKQAEEKLTNSLKELTQLSQQYQNLTRRRNVVQNNVNSLFSTREDLMLQAAEQSTPWQLTESPSSPVQVASGSNQVRELIIGLMAGVLAGAAAVYLAEKIDRKIYSLEQLKQSITLPILGSIPFYLRLSELGEVNSENYVLPLQPSNQLNNETSQNDSPSQSVNENDGYDDFSFQEAFRSFYTNLSFMNPDNPIRSLAITSSIPGEGKTVNTIYLAKSAAIMGNRVLLVDGDLRNPKLHQYLDLTNSCGLSNLLSTNISLEEAIQPSRINENISVLTSGTLPPEPASLLGSEKLKELIQQWENLFDLVIFDTPPAGILADAKVLAPLTNGLIVVTGLGVIDKTVFKDLMDSLQLSSLPLLGVIANGVTPDSVPKYEEYNQQYYNARNQANQIAKISSTSNNKN